MGPLPVLALALGLAVPAEGARTAASTLEGTAWKLLIDQASVPEGLWSSDLLLFVRGRFAAIECLALGFAPSEYASSVESGLLHWRASQTAPGGTRLSWSGVRRGGRMTGRLSWQDPGREPLELPWKAVLRPPPAALPPGL